MAVNSSRSQRASLNEGATDGKYRKVRPNTEPGVPGAAETMKNRQHLHEWWNYGTITQEVPPNDRVLPA